MRNNTRPLIYYEGVKVLRPKVEGSGTMIVVAVFLDADDAQDYAHKLSRTIEGVTLRRGDRTVRLRR
jgi:hypothetical protein